MINKLMYTDYTFVCNYTHTHLLYLQPSYKQQQCQTNNIDHIADDSCYYSWSNYALIWSKDHVFHKHHTTHLRL